METNEIPEIKTPEFVLSPEQINEVRNAALEKARNTKHRIKQRGPYLVCTSCDYPHTLLHIGVNKRLTGIAKDGSPILEDLKR